MPRYALKIDYHGGPYHGWQKQASHVSVQGEIERAVRMLEPQIDRVYGAGRTDAGVHATGQVAHVDLSGDWDGFKLAGALNHFLRPHPIAILAVARVADDFHARFQAVERRYIYKLQSRRAPLTHTAGLVWRVKHPLDVDAMAEGAKHLLGRHDFTTFRSTQCQSNSPVKSLDAVNVAVVDGIIEFELLARSFLHNQVRSIVGTLERVGAGSWEPDRVRTALEACDRAACGPMAPSDGLYLTDIRYDIDPFAP